MNIPSAATLSILLTLVVSPLRAAPLPDSVLQMLNRHRIPLAAASVEVRKLQSGEKLISERAHTPRNPASVMKLVTTLAALEILGPTYRWQTRYYLDGVLANGTLDGNLVIRGGGDPLLLPRDFRSHLQALKNRGLEKINGSLVIDNGAVDAGNMDRARFDGSPNRVYNVIPSATMINFSATRVVVQPVGNQLQVFADPPADNLRIDNRLTPVATPCRSRWGGWSSKIHRDNSQPEVTLSGTYPLACGMTDFTRAILSNNEYVHGVFSAFWRQAGGSFSGGLRLAPTPADASLLHAADSRPLTEVINGVNKYSNNTMARQLLLTLARESGHVPGTPAKGIEVVRAWYLSQQIDMPELAMENGSGLSRIGRISAGSLSALLQIGWNSACRAEFMSSFSLAGIDGTMRKRLKKESPAGRVRIKTGLLYQTRAMAGYVKAGSGDYYSVVMLLNHPSVTYWSGNQVQDALLRWLVRL